MEVTIRADAPARIRQREKAGELTKSPLFRGLVQGVQIAKRRTIFVRSRKWSSTLTP